MIILTNSDIHSILHKLLLLFKNDPHCAIFFYKRLQYFDYSWYRVLLVLLELEYKIINSFMAIILLFYLILLSTFNVIRVKVYKIINGFVYFFICISFQSDLINYIKKIF